MTQIFISIFTRFNGAIMAMRPFCFQRGIKPTIFILVSTLCPAVYAEYQVIEQVVAIAEDDVVLASEVRDEMAKVHQRLIANKRPLPDNNALFAQVLEQRILRSLQLQRAEKIGLRTSDQQLNDTMNSIAARNNLSLTEFKLSVESQGQSYIDIRNNIRQDMIIREVQRRSVIRTINIDQSEVDNFLNSEKGKALLEIEYNIDHILLAINTEASKDTVAAAKIKMIQLKSLATLKGGFSAIADRAEIINAEHNPLGWRRFSDVPMMFQSTVKNTLEGEISEPIRSDSGLHIIHILAKRGGVEGTQTETNVRHILIAPNEIRSVDEAKILAAEVRQKILAGEDFAFLAREYSDDPGSALTGGDLGWSKPGTLVPEFETMMANTDIDKTSAIFKSQFGWHILQVSDRREKDLSSELANQRARMAIAETKYDDALSNWLQDLRDNAYVDIK
tara:strand:- start:5056 stop:6399 length:1344 start_codon:yes stop_codon:yes gene_type:complete